MVYKFEPMSEDAHRRFRFWLLYAAAWLPYAASFTFVFISQGSTWRSALLDTAYNIVPAALLGVAVFRLCERVPWTLHRRRWFFPAQVGFAVLYATLWVASVSAVFTAVSTLRRGEFTLNYLRSYALNWEFFSGLMIYGTLASVAYVRQTAARLREEEARRAHAETLRARAELEALRAQLNPHFLFNTLHSVMALVRRNDAAAAEDALERFADLLRYVLRVQQRAAANGGSRADDPRSAENSDGDMNATGDRSNAAADDVTLADEWAFVNDYLALERIRLGGRLRVAAEIEEDALDCRLPAFTLQPLVENAVKHAVAPRAEGGEVRVTAGLDGAGALRLEVRDDGPGASQEALAHSRGLGLGLVRARLEARYGGRAAFSVETEPGAGFIVRMVLPAGTGRRGREVVRGTEAGRWQFAR